MLTTQAMMKSNRRTECRRVFHRNENEDEAKHAGEERGDVRLASLVQEGGAKNHDAWDKVIEVPERAIDVLAEDVDAKRHLQGADVDEASTARTSAGRSRR